MWTPVATQAGSRALERLGHRPAAAGRSEGRRVRVHAGHRGRARVRRRLAERRARADPGRRDRRRQAVHRRRRSRSTRRSARIHFFKALIEKADGDYDARAARRSRRRAATYPARPRRAQPDRPHSVPEAPLRRGVARAASACGRRSRGSADALHGDALLPRAGQTASRPRARRSCSGASRPTSRRRRSPQRRRLISPEDNNERQPIHDHETRAARTPASEDGSSSRSAVVGGAARWLRRAGRRHVHRRHRRRPASTSPTTAAGPARSSCRRRWAPACAFLDADGDGWLDILLVNGKDWTPRGRRVDRRALPQQRQRQASPTSRAAAASTSRCTASASPSATTTTTAATTSTSPRSRATGCFTTRAAASSAT